MTTPPTTDIDLTEAIAACIDKVRLYNNVTFAELTKLLTTHGVPTGGSYAMEPNGYPNMFFWAAMSAEFYDIASALLRHEHIELRSSHLLTYISDGQAFTDAPLAKKPPKGGYKKPHWCPVVFVWTGARPSHDEFLAEIRR